MCALASIPGASASTALPAAEPPRGSGLLRPGEWAVVSPRVSAWERRAGIEPGKAAEFAVVSAGSIAEEVRGEKCGAVWADPGGGA